MNKQTLTKLDPVRHHLDQAMFHMRELPPGDLLEEKLRTEVYHYLYAAQEAILKCVHSSGSSAPEQAPALAADLLAVFGG